MPVVRIEYAVPDIKRWKRVFDSDPADRKGSGVRRYQALRSHEDPNFVMVDLEFDTLREAEAYLRKMERVWEGPGSAVMRSPRARIAQRIEAREL